MTINHLNEIFKIEKLSFNNPWTINNIKKDILNNNKNENWVYIEQNKVVGYIFGLILIDEYHLNNIAVDPKYLRNKIGTKLILHIISILKTKGIKFILLEVSSKNLVAQRCYKNLGFYSVGKRKNYYGKGDDAILYNLEINNGRMV